jgi:hypothetical protein
MSQDFAFVDGSSVIAVAGGTIESLRRVVHSATLGRRDRTRSEPGSRRGLSS